MGIKDYNYLWESEKENWVLVNTEYGYCIINKMTKMALVISDDDLEQAIIAKMQDTGCQVYENISTAYKDI